MIVALVVETHPYEFQLLGNIQELLSRSSLSSASQIVEGFGRTVLYSLILVAKFNFN